MTTTLQQPIKNEGRVKYYLEIWKAWMLHDEHKLGYPKKSSYCMASSVSSFEDMADQVDHSAALAMDAIISGLPMSQQIAINHFNLSAVWKSNREIIEDVYQEALQAIERGLNLRGMA